MSANTLFIGNVDLDITAEYITRAFDHNKIAKVSSIILIANVKNNVNQAYITIGSWYDTESAYNFIQRLKDTTKEARIVHHLDDWWPVHLIVLDNKYDFIDRHMLQNINNVTLRSHQRRLVY